MSHAAPERDKRSGFALIEVMLALMLIALLAALALPGLRYNTGNAALRLAAIQVSALLREDRNVARGGGRAIASVIERGGRRIASGSSSATVDLPAEASARLLDSAAPKLCFFADGRSSGGSILIATANSRYVVKVNRDTGAIRVDEP